MFIRIGSDFSSNDLLKDQSSNGLPINIYNYDIVLTQTGREAIRLALKQPLALASNIFVIPPYLCNSVFSQFEGKNIVRYKIDEHFETMLPSFNEKFTYTLFITNYFGLSNEDKLFEHIANIKQKIKIFVIYDITHSIFNETNFQGCIDCYIASLRKWLPIADGGMIAYNFNGGNPILKKSTNSFVDLKIKAMDMKARYLLSEGKLEGLANYKNYFNIAEEMLNESTACEEYSISNYSNTILNMYDYDTLKIIRRSNFNVLLNKMSFKTIKPVFTTMNEKQVPLVFPVWCDERNKLREYLAEKNIFCPIHWNDDCVVGKGRLFKNKIMSIPIDQRYGLKDMHYILNCIEEYEKC